VKRFKPRRYTITREMLEQYRQSGEGVRKIGRRFGAHPTTVRNWLIRLKLPTAGCIDTRETSERPS
jgi:transposase-like protein